MDDGGNRTHSSDDDSSQSSTPSSSNAGRSDIRVALGLYSVREECERDWPGTLKAIAEMGYEGVEFAGYHGWSAKSLRQILTDHGLGVASCHVGLNMLTDDELNKTVEFHQELGVALLVIPYHEETSAEGWRSFAAELAEISDRLGAYGMQVGYHNHTHEMQPVDGAIPWEIIFDNTPFAVSHQPDTGHMVRGGRDPAAYIRRYPGRTRTVHLKEYDPEDEHALLGEGKVNWREVLEACHEAGGTEWYIIEAENCPCPPLECVAACLRNLRRIAG